MKNDQIFLSNSKKKKNLSFLNKYEFVKMYNFFVDSMFDLEKWW
jgi:hypothetical protein